MHGMDMAMPAMDTMSTQPLSPSFPNPGHRAIACHRTLLDLLEQAMVEEELDSRRNVRAQHGDAMRRTSHVCTPADAAGHAPPRHPTPCLDPL